MTIGNSGLIAGMKLQVLIVGIALLAGCTVDNSGSEIADDTAAIEALTDQGIAAYIARDWDAFADFFTDDAVWMPPGMPALTGRDEWWQFAEPWWDTSTVVEMEVTHDEIIITGDWAIERHSEFQAIRAGEDGEIANLYLKGVWILQRQDSGTWKIARYIWNEDPRQNEE